MKFCSLSDAFNGSYNFSAPLPQPSTISCHDIQKHIYECRECFMLLKYQFEMYNKENVEREMTQQACFISPVSFSILLLISMVILLNIRN